MLMRRRRRRSPIRIVVIGGRRSRPQNNRLRVAVTGSLEETPELWADLVEFVLDAMARERQRRKHEGGKDHAA
jgi:hypothetical protein